MTKKNKKKTAREKRILVGAFLTAVVIAAGSTFAWFTSTDTVTNRLSANADYNVKIVESFAPPENWMPGEKVDKDVYAVNTGNIEAFAKATISGMMSITREVPVQLDSISTQGDGTVTWSTVADNGTTTALPEAPTGVNPVGNGVFSDGTPVDVPTGDDDTDTLNDTKANYYVDNGNDEPTFYYCEDATDPTEVWYVWNGTNFTESSNPGNAKPVTGDPVYYGSNKLNPDNATHYKDNGDGTYTWYQKSGDEGGLNFTADGVYNCVTLNDNEVYAIEAGAFLAWAPAEDKVNNTLGNKAIAFKEPTENGRENGDAAKDTYQGLTVNNEWVPLTEEQYNKNEDPNGSSLLDKKLIKGDPTNSLKTDFKPHADGLYVFRRQIVVEGDENSHAAGTETFKYEGYYFLGGKYYKIMNLTTTTDKSPSNGVAGDGTTKDGILTAANAYLVKEEKQYLEQPDSFEYDSIRNRIVATYNTNTESKLLDDNMATLAAELDRAEHNLVKAEQLLERTLADQGIVNDAIKEHSKIVDDASLAYKNALADYNKAVADYNNAKNEYQSGKAGFVPAKDAALAALQALAGSGADDSVTGKSDAADRASDGWDATESKLTNGNVVIVSEDENAAANKYGKALAAYNEWAAQYLVNNNEHFIYTYLVELSRDATPEANWATDSDNGNHYVLPAGWGGAAVPTGVDMAAIKAQIAIAAQSMTYDYASKHLNWVDNATLPDNEEDKEFHDFHQLFVDLITKEKDYNDALSAYNIAIANLNVAINELVPVSGAFEAIDTSDGTTDKVNAARLNELDAWNSGDAAAVKAAYKALTGLEPIQEDNVVDNFTPKSETDIQKLADAPASPSAEFTLWDAWQKLVDAKNKLKAVEDTTYIDPTTGLPYGQSVHMDGTDEVDNIKDDEKVSKSLQDAWNKYYEARNAKDEAEDRLLAAQNGFSNNGDLKIYIYLQNVSITGKEGNKWQLLPTTINEEKKAVFYYTSILAAGEVSKQLIDYVELDESASQEMYKTFDYDLNVALESAQVTYADDAATLRTAEAANKMFTWTDSKNKTHNIKGSIADPTAIPSAQNNPTVVSWSDSAANVASEPEAPGEVDGNTEVQNNHTYTVDGAEVTMYEIGTPKEYGGQTYNYGVKVGNDWYYGTNDSGVFYMFTVSGQDGELAPSNDHTVTVFKS